jgi:hypothetical protein
MSDVRYKTFDYLLFDLFNLSFDLFTLHFQYPVRPKRCPDHIRRTSGIKEQDPIHNFIHHFMRVAENDRIKLLPLEAFLDTFNDLRRRAMTMDKADRDLFAAKDQLFWQSLPQIRSIHIPKNGANLLHRLETLKQGDIREIAEMHDKVGLLKLILEFLFKALRMRI